MSFLADKTKNLVDLGKTIKNKTQEYSTIAKLTLDIKKFENEQEKSQIEIGQYVLEKIKAGDTTLELNDEKLTTHSGKIKELDESIKEKKDAIEEHKKKAASES